VQRQRRRGDNPSTLTRSASRPTRRLRRCTFSKVWDLGVVCPIIEEHDGDLRKAEHSKPIPSRGPPRFRLGSGCPPDSLSLALPRASDAPSPPSLTGRPAAQPGAVPAATWLLSERPSPAVAYARERGEQRIPDDLNATALRRPSAFEAAPGARPGSVSIGGSVRP
jgi:hypothetical protein